MSHERAVDKAPVEEIRIDKVQVGVRRRQKLGSVVALAKSIEGHGLAHPILIRGDNVLVCGARRLAAFEHLGRVKIPARRVDGLSDRELRELELAENINRQDLNDRETTERRLAEILQAEALLKAKAAEGANSARVAGRKRPHRVTGGKKGPRGRKPGSRRAVAEATGVADGTRHDLEQHQHYYTKYPFLGAPGWTMDPAVRAGKMLDGFPEPDQIVLGALFAEPGIPPDTALKVLHNLTDSSPERRRAIFELLQDADDHIRSKGKSLAVAEPPAPDPALPELDEAWTHLRAAARAYRGTAAKEQIGSLIAGVEATRQVIEQEGRDDGQAVY